MGPNRETPLDFADLRARRTAWIFAVATMLLPVVGCNPQLEDDSDVKAMARSWPAYRAPNLEASTANMNIWPGQVAVASPRAHSRGVPPQLDNPMPVIKSHRDWNLEETAMDSLARIGEPAVFELIKALRSPEPKVRYQAAQVLGRIGPPAEAAVSALVRTMEDPELQVRKAAARALGQIGPDAGEAVRALMNVINSPGDQRPSIPSPMPSQNSAPGDFPPPLP